MFGVPLSQCVEGPLRKRSTASDAPTSADDVASPGGASGTSGASAGGSRTSVGSLTDRAGMEGVSAPGASTVRTVCRVDSGDL